MQFYTNIARKGNNLLYRGVENGKRVERKVEFSPSLFTKTLDKAQETSKNLEGESLQEIILGSMSEIYDYKRDQMLPVYGDVNPIWQYVNKSFPDLVSFDENSIKISNIDIEVYSVDEFPNPDEAKHPITAITVARDGKFYTFGLDNKQFGGMGGGWVPNNEYSVSSSVVYNHFIDEEELLKSFLEFWSADYCDVITGWNIDGFDINYIVNRVAKLLNKAAVEKLSPWGIVKSRTYTDDWGTDRISWSMVGISVLDYLALYKEYTYSKLESYKLNHVAFVELGEEKLSYDAAEGLHGLYVSDYQKYIDYNIQDVNLVDRLDVKMKLFGIIFTVAYLAKINYEDVFSPVRTWDALIYHHLIKENIQVPPMHNAEKTGKIPGGYVKAPIVGRHGWLTSFDLASLYPSLIRQYNLGTETFVPRYDLPENIREVTKNVSIDKLLAKEIDLSVLKEANLSMTANGECWKRDKKSFFSTLMENLYMQRKGWKKEMMVWKKEKETVLNEMKKRGISPT